MRYFGMRFDTVGPVVYANKIPPEMPGWSAGYNPWCNDGCPRYLFKGTTSVEFAKLANNFGFKTCLFSTNKIYIDLHRFAIYIYLSNI